MGQQFEGCDAVLLGGIRIVVVKGESGSLQRPQGWALNPTPPGVHLRR